MVRVHVREQTTNYGRMAERLNATDLKSVSPNGFVGSNPTSFYKTKGIIPYELLSLSHERTQHIRRDCDTVNRWWVN